MADTSYLVLQDGSVFRGEAFGAEQGGYGEVVFNTAMTGYQEVLTDPSYAGQMVTLTYPLVGNYGINPEDYESRCIQVSGMIVREHCDRPSHSLNGVTLHEFLRSQGIPGLCGVDTRAITRRLRSSGVMMGVMTRESPELALEMLAEQPAYDDVDFVRTVSTDAQYRWDEPPLPPDAPGYRILVHDCGLKYNILRLLRKRGCEVIAVSAAASAEEMLALEPSGILVSPGPGDPRLLDYVVSNIRKLLDKTPIMGICLGHQMVARALGADTFKLKFGHRGANHPVQDLDDGRVYITAQNHGYAVSDLSLPPGLEVTHVNLNDGTIEGLRHRDYPVFTIQYHSEASPGPRDNEYLFDRFIALLSRAN